MARLIRDFVLPCSDECIYKIILERVPESYIEMKEYEFRIEDEIEEEDRFYRKMSYQKEPYMSMVPSIIKENAPKQLLDSSNRVIEESIFYRKEKKIRWAVNIENLDSYRMCGTTCIIPLSDEMCKISLIIRFEMKEDGFFKPLLEKWIPDTLAAKTRKMYMDLMPR